MEKFNRWGYGVSGLGIGGFFLNRHVLGNRVGFVKKNKLSSDL